MNVPARVRVVVRGSTSTPFRIVRVEGLDDGLSLIGDLPDEPAETHHLTFQLKKAAPAAFRRKLEIITDLEKTAPVTVVIEGSVSEK